MDPALKVCFHFYWTFCDVNFPGSCVNYEFPGTVYSKKHGQANTAWVI